MGGGFRGLEAATLIDGHIHQDGPRFHGFEHLAGDQFGRFGAWDQHGADDDVGPLDEFPQSCRAGKQAEAVGRHHVAQITQAVQVQVEDIHLGSQAAGHLGRIDSDNPAADNDHIARINPRDSPQQHAVTALGHFQVLGPLLDRHSAGHFAHRGQQGQGAIRLLNGFISDADTFAANKDLGQLFSRCQVQVGEDNLAFPDQIVLGRQRFLDVHHHVGPFKYFPGGCDNLRTGFIVGRILETAAAAGTFFHQQRVPVGDHDLHSGRRHAHPIFLCLDFF